MKFTATLAALAAATAVSAQAANESICDKYTTALLMNNTAANQLTVLTLVVNTALIGNYTNPAGPAKNAVNGILTNGTYMGTPVSLIKYFDGSLLSTNQNGKPAAVSFLDGGGAVPLMNNTAANDTTSNQYTLVTHLYQLFGSLLGCSMQNSTSVFKNYQGSLSMSDVHQFMNIDANEEAYFIQQVGLSATSFGVSTADATAVGAALTGLFSKRCAPPVALVPGASMNYSQSVCVASDCPLADNSNCTASAMNYGNGTNGMDPAMATTAPSTGSSSGSGSSGSGSSGSGSSGSSGSGTDGAAGLIINAVGVLALAAAGLVAVGL